MIVLFLAEGFEEVEALTPLDILRRAGLDVKTVGIGGQFVTGSHGITVRADIPDGDFTPQAVDCVVLPGGMPGTKNLAKSEKVLETLKRTKQADGILSAICAAPSVLGQNGYLVGKRATCFPGFEETLTGAVKVPDKVVKDGNVLTGAGMGCAKEFGIALAEMLAGKEIADKIASSIQSV